MTYKVKNLKTGVSHMVSKSAFESFKKKRAGEFEFEEFKEVKKNNSKKDNSLIKEQENK